MVDSGNKKPSVKEDEVVKNPGVNELKALVEEEQHRETNLNKELNQIIKKCVQSTEKISKIKRWAKMAEGYKKNARSLPYKDGTSHIMLLQ